MKKRLFILATALLLAGTIQAQIFLQEGDENNLRDVTATPVSAWPDNPSNSQGNDYYVPVGSGIALLATLGGAYLICRKKNSLEI